LTEQCDRNQGCNSVVSYVAGSTEQLDVQLATI